MKDIKCSIICTAYNHEKYIRQTLDGFLAQKTDFSYEIIIHDDASTDKTAEIIGEYASKFPEIIKPVFQRENQYSKGLNIGVEFLYPKARGRYFAYCEGDDYWCDVNKLQKQIDFLEKYPEYVACVHNSFLLFPNGREKIRFPLDDFDLELKDVVMCGGQSFQTSSLVYRRETRDRRPPEFLFSISGIGDYPFAIFLAMCGKIHYMGNPMSVYRVATPGSWTIRMEKNHQAFTNVRLETLKMLELANDYSEGRYNKIFKNAEHIQKYSLLECEGRFKEMLKPEYRDCYVRMAVKDRLKLRAKAYFPFLAKNKNR